ncbi:MAG TPA: hypothetical protein VGM90_30850 [Kofleriaceae bacterium]|jgi:hypothetical protein
MRLLVAAGLVLVGCAGDDGIKVEGGLECPDFARITSGDVTFDDEAITLIVSMKGELANLTFDQPGFHEAWTEYDWGASIDEGRDGKYDWRISLEHVHRDNTAPHVEMDPSVAGDAGIHGFFDISDVSIGGVGTASVNGSTVKIVIQRDQSELIHAIKKGGSRFAYSTYYRSSELEDDYCQTSFTKDY